MSQKNKVKFNLKNVHFAKKTAAGVYGTPFAHKGAVSLSMDAQGDLNPFYADGVKYFVGAANNGYEGDLEVAMVTDEFRTQILNELTDDNGVMFEDGDAATTEFAFGFQIDGDQNGTYFWYYGCTATRPSTEANTKEDTIDPQTDSFTISCAGDDFEYGSETKRLIRAKSTDSAETATWFDAVVVPTVA